MSNEWLADGARKVRARRDALPMAARPVITVPGKRHSAITTLTASDRSEIAAAPAPITITMHEVYEGDYLLLVTGDSAHARDIAQPGDRIVTAEWTRERPAAAQPAPSPELELRVQS